MKRPNTIIYTVMFLLIICFLFMFGLQRTFKIFNLRPLSGVIEVPEIKRLNFKNYYDFSFQQSVEKNLEASFGFREPLIRLYNQYLWDLYKKFVSKQVLIGKDNWLFPKWHQHIPKYSQELTEKFDQRAHYIYQLSNILKEYNTQLLVCMVPSKFEVYGEYVPSDMSHLFDFDPIGYYCDKFDESGVNYINFTPMLYDIKEKEVYKPFAQTGAHWTSIAAIYATDSIFKRFTALSGINMPKMKIGEPYIAKTKNPDNDLDQLLNLIRPLPCKPNYYANVEIIEDSTTVRPKMITIGDSHFWNITYNVPLEKMFSDYPYWYYGKSIYFDKKHQHTNQVNLTEELISADYVLILYSASQIYNLNSEVILRGIISLCFDEDEVNKVIEKITNSIQSSPEWFESIKQKAQQNGISVEESLHNDAVYMICENPYNYFPLSTTEVPTKRNKENAAIYDRLKTK